MQDPDQAPFQVSWHVITWRFLMFFYRFWRSLKVFDGFWWFFDGFWCFFQTVQGFLFFCWCFSRCFMVFEGLWWGIQINPRTLYILNINIVSTPPKAYSNYLCSTSPGDGVIFQLCFFPPLANIQHNSKNEFRVRQKNILSTLGSL